MPPIEFGWCRTCLTRRAPALVIGGAEPCRPNPLWHQRLTAPEEQLRAITGRGFEHPLDYADGQFRSLRVGAGALGPRALPTWVGALGLARARIDQIGTPAKSGPPLRWYAISVALLGEHLQALAARHEGRSRAARRRACVVWAVRRDAGSAKRALTAVILRANFQVCYSLSMSRFRLNSVGATMTRALRILSSIVVLLLSCVVDKAIAQQKTVHEFKFNKASITTLPKQDQERILMILRGAKLISPKEDLSTLDGLQTTDILNDLGRALCRAACESSRTSAQGACAAMSNGTAAAACHLAAGAGQTHCKEGCSQIAKDPGH